MGDLLQLVRQLAPRPGVDHRAAVSSVTVRLVQAPPNRLEDRLHLKEADCLRPSTVTSHALGQASLAPFALAEHPSVGVEQLELSGGADVAHDERTLTDAPEALTLHQLR